MYRMLIGFFAALLLVTGAAKAADKPMSASREEAVSAEAQVRAVDHKARIVLVRMEDGEEVELVAGPEVRNLDQVMVGDMLVFTYYESVAAKMAEAGADRQPSAAVVTERAAEGAKPGMVAASAMHTVVEFVSYDEATNIATFINADGNPGSVVVKPEMREFASTRSAGDLIDITITQAVAIGIEPR